MFIFDKKNIETIWIGIYASMGFSFVKGILYTIKSEYLNLKNDILLIRTIKDVIKYINDVENIFKQIGKISSVDLERIKNFPLIIDKRINNYKENIFLGTLKKNDIFYRSEINIYHNEYNFYKDDSTGDFSCLNKNKIENFLKNNIKHNKKLLEKIKKHRKISSWIIYKFKIHNRDF